MSAFDTCYPSVSREEGGFVNDPRDPGGITNLGVTKKAWEVYNHRPASVAEMRALTVSGVKEFYRSQYWNVVHGDYLPLGLALCLFHCAVNAGPGRAAMLLQEIVGATPDGGIGPATMRAVAVWVANHGEKVAIHAFQDALRAYYRTRKTFPTFGHGWLNRAEAVEAEAMGLAS